LHASGAFGRYDRRVERFSVGTVLDDGLRAYPRVLARTLPLAVVCFAPLLLLPPDWRAVGLATEAPLIATISADLVARLRGEPISVGTALARGLRRTPALLGTALLIALVVFALAFVFALPIYGASNPTATQATLRVISVLAFFAVLLALYARWFVALPSAVFDRAGAPALTRSGQLTRGHRGSLVAVIVVEGALVAAATILVLVAISTNGRIPTREPAWLPAALLLAALLVEVLRATLSAVAPRRSWW
jgi:hypothetical protein